VKKLLIFLVVVAALGAAGIFWAWHSLDVIVKAAIEHFGPDIAGVPVTVRDVKLSATDGKGSLKGVEIGNPPGFAARRAARLGEMRVAVDPLTLRESLVVIQEIAIDAPEITYEKGAKATNLEVIQKNIENYVARTVGSAEPPAAAPKGLERRYVIEKLSIRAARVTMTNPALKGQGITFTLPDIELRGIGKRPNGVTAAQAANVVVAAITTRIAQRVLTNLELLRKGGKEGALDALRSILK